VKVAGLTINSTGSDILTKGASDSKVSINLAWLFLLLPLIGSSLIIGNKIRKRYLLH